MSKMISQKTTSLLLLTISLSASRLIDFDFPDESDRLESPSFLDRYLLEELDEGQSKWTEDEMKLYMRGVEDNSTVVTFSAKVYYTIEVGERTGGKIVELVDAMLDRFNKELEDLGALTRVQLHCLEEMTWTSQEVIASNSDRRVGLMKYKNRSRNSADVLMYIGLDPTPGVCARGYLGPGVKTTFYSFGHFMVSWYNLRCVTYVSDIGLHEVGHNLGVDHDEMEDKTYYGRVYKTFRFALAAIGDESEACPEPEADWVFRSRCFKSFGKYAGDELENEACTPAENAKDCQAHCAATEGCSFFAFKGEKYDTEVSCGGHKAESCADCPQVDILHPFDKFLL